MKGNQISSSVLINITLIILTVFNVLYWPGKFLDFMPEAYLTLRTNYFLLLVLQFLACASIFVDLVVRFDKFGKSEKILRLILTMIFCGSFVVQVVMSVMELYIQGGIK